MAPLHSRPSSTTQPQHDSVPEARCASHVRRSTLSWSAAIALVVGMSLGCGPAADTAAKSTDTKANGATDAKATTGGAADSAGGNDTAAKRPGEGGTGGAVATPSATGGPADAATGGPADTATGGPADAATGGTDQAAGSPEETAAKIEALLDEVKSKKTKDARALEALDEAKALGAEPRPLAEAATKRGKAFITDVERATVFFEWARAADEKWPDATFELAKFACNTGDIDITKELLTEVKARGGKKLLKTVEFDPTFALVVSDPEVLALLK